MNRIVTLLLVPFMSLGQAVPYSHGSVRSSSDHSSRPHFHTGHVHDEHGHDHDERGHHHDEHERESSSEGESTDCPEDHDSDAVYLSGDQYFLSQTGKLRRPAVQFALASVLTAGSVSLLDASRAWSLNASPIHVGGRPALFLLHAALRL